MNHKLSIIAALGCTISSAFAQTAVKIGFETAVLDTSRVMNGRTGETNFTESKMGYDFSFPIYYDTLYKYWSGGWAISRKYDSASVASDFKRHLYCNKAFSGYQSSNTFAIGTQNSFFTHNINSNALSGIWITNNTYTYNSMKFGDAFAKKFGGVSGNDSDYLLLRAMHFVKGVLIDSSEIYLGDFRFANNAKDYLLDSWQLLKISGDSVVFTIEGSDNGQWGLNTPAYFAIDEVTAWIASVRNLDRVSVDIHPNPAQNTLNVHVKSAILSIKITDISGKSIAQNTLNYYGNNATVDLIDIPNGMYFIRVQTASGTGTQKLIIQH